MASIREVKTNLRHREWEEQIRECQSSGMKVRDWCKTNGLNETTYYRRLRIIREEYLQSGGNSAQHQIVSVGVSNEIAGAISNQTSSAKPDSQDKVVMRKGGIEIELPQSISQSTLPAVLRGLGKC